MEAPPEQQALALGLQQPELALRELEKVLEAWRQRVRAPGQQVAEEVALLPA
jgi:hypothetical protein